MRRLASACACAKSAADNDQDYIIFHGLSLSGVAKLQPIAPQGGALHNASNLNMLIPPH